MYKNTTAAMGNKNTSVLERNGSAVEFGEVDSDVVWSQKMIM